VSRKRNHIILKMKSRCWRMTHKFGIRLPHTVEEAPRSDKEMGTDFWRKALEKEMSKVKVAWKVHDSHTLEQMQRGEALEFIGFQEIKCHVVFDVRMDFAWKCRFVAGGHTTDTPSSITHSSVVSQDSVQLAFVIAALNNLDVMSCDLQNTCVNAPCQEKIWFEGGLKTGEGKGEALAVVHALHGLNSSGASWRAMCTKTLEDLKFELMKADPDIWIHAARRDDGFDYCEMVLVHVDDVLATSHHAKDALLEIGQHHKFKDNSLKKPD